MEYFKIPNPFYAIGRAITRREYSLRDEWEPNKPRMEGCTQNSYGLHKWEWNTSWNGNDRRVLPFLPKSWTHGIGRSGHRCYNCGKMVWQESDERYALSMAFSLGYLPGVKQFLKTGEWPTVEEKKDVA